MTECAECGRKKWACRRRIHVDFTTWICEKCHDKKDQKRVTGFRTGDKR